MTRCIAIILAAGDGVRSGFVQPKQLVKLAGKPLIAHTLERFQTHPGIDEIAIVTNSACADRIESLVCSSRFGKVRKVLLGGTQRHESSLAAIRAYADDARQGPLNLLFHDAVRPLVSHRVISDVIAALGHYHAVDTAVRATDTVLLANPSTDDLQSIPDRRTVRLGQTPQGFRYETIRQAYALAARDPDFRTTDDCGVVLKYLPQERIHAVDGELSNMKLTYAEDLLLLDKLMQTCAGKRLDAQAETLLLSELARRVLVIIGGTSGIGAAMAKLAADYGASVCAVGRSTGVDVTRSDTVREALSSAAAKFGHIDAVVNAAATLDRSPLSNMSDADVAASIDTNITGAINVARLSFEHLQKTHGHLMLFTSSSYTYGRAFYSTYSSAKAAVVNLTQALADEWSDAGIKVNCINPGRTATPMRTRAFGIEDPATLLDADDVARRALGVLVGRSSGLVHDIIQGSHDAPH
jgi:2-C-methyl-D-erythritol 4-phosphate cytidylyltransferase